MCALCDLEVVIAKEIKEISNLAKRMKGLAKRAVKEYEIVVEDILDSNSRDISFIENTLDGLLDFCFDPDALLFYRRLCRHYYEIDAVAATNYVNAYREMWDSE